MENNAQLLGRRLGTTVAAGLPRAVLPEECANPHVSESPAGARLQETEQNSLLAPAPLCLPAPDPWGLPVGPAVQEAGLSPSGIRVGSWLCGSGQITPSLWACFLSSQWLRKVVPPSLEGQGFVWHAPFSGRTVTFPHCLIPVGWGMSPGHVGTRPLSTGSPN